MQKLLETAFYGSNQACRCPDDGVGRNHGLIGPTARLAHLVSVGAAESRGQS